MTERNAVRTAIRTATLSAVPELKAFISFTDNQTQFPFVTWGIIEQAPAFDYQQETINVYNIQIDIWDRSKSPTQVETILEKLQLKFHKKTFEVSGYSNLTAYQTNAFYIYDADPTIIHGIYRVRVEMGY